MQCPGQDSRYWDGEAIFESACSKCGNIVEFFKDDSKRKCKKCGHEVLNPKIDFGCAAYCPHAEHCLGSLPPEMLAQKQDLLIERVAIEVKKLCEADFKKIAAAAKMARHAKSLAMKEEGNKAVVQIAAYLLQIIHKETEETDLLKIKDLLLRLGAAEGLTEEVCQIITDFLHGIIGESINFKVFRDASFLTSLEADKKAADKDTFIEVDEKTFLTINGKIMAQEIIKK